jgi:uncharacterized protein YukE
MADKIVCTPQIMDQVAKMFTQLYQDLDVHTKNINNARNNLIIENNGSWQGLGRDAFEEKFQEEIRPAWKDVRDALKAGSKLSYMLLGTMSEAVEESTNLLNQMAIKD